MYLIYRYLRPLKFELDKSCLSNSDKGGICFAIKIENDILSFSFARCHLNKFFNKDLIKEIATQRFQNNEIYSFKIDNGLSITNNIKLFIFFNKSLVKLQENVKKIEKMTIVEQATFLNYSSRIHSVSEKVYKNS